MPAKLPHNTLQQILLPAYKPCKHFGKCPQARWCPQDGHVPRGFLGATGKPDEVEVIMVLAEPGLPLPNEQYPQTSDCREMLKSAVNHTYECYEEIRGVLHRKARCFIDKLYPKLSFDEQLRRVWLTEGRLCSYDTATNNPIDRICAKHYLALQIDALPNAIVVPFGGRARDAVRIAKEDVKRSNLKVVSGNVYALAPPAANRPRAKHSWEEAISEIKARRKRKKPKTKP